MRIPNLVKIVERGLEQGAKSIFFFPGFPPLANRGVLSKLDNVPLENEDVEAIFKMTASEWQVRTFEQQKELDYSYGINKVGRFRVSAFSNLGNLALVMRAIPLEVPAFETLGLPEALRDLARLRDGLVLITGPTGVGKSTTVASLIDTINKERSAHIVTVEDPIEFVYRPENSIISQREVGRDTESFGEALRRVLREDPDVILVGEVRDADSLKMLLEMAETGHLVFCTLHTANAVQTMQRMFDLFPESEKTQVRTQISQVLRAVVAQRLLNRLDGRGYVVACEVLKVNSAVRSMIRADKLHEMYSVIDSSGKEGMISMDKALFGLYDRGLIDIQQVIAHSSQDKHFLQEIAAHVPRTDDSLTGSGVLDLQRENVTYATDYSFDNLRCFDASGVLVDSPAGLLFRDTGQSKGRYNFIADYTILNGKVAPFPLHSFFSLSYRILDAKIGKEAYTFRVRIMESSKETIEISKTPFRLVPDGNWHTLTIPIPKIYAHRMVKYYMLMFDDDVKEIVFSNLRFV